MLSLRQDSNEYNLADHIRMSFIKMSISWVTRTERTTNNPEKHLIRPLQMWFRLRPFFNWYFVLVLGNSIALSLSPSRFHNNTPFLIQVPVLRSQSEIPNPLIRYLLDYRCTTVLVVCNSANCCNDEAGLKNNVDHGPRRVINSELC